MPGGYLTIAPCSWSARSLRARRKHSGLRPETPFVTTGAERRCTFVGASLYFRFSGMGLPAGTAHGGLQEHRWANAAVLM